MTTVNRTNIIKVLPPRNLAEKETTHSLSQWKINFRQYCKKDDSYRTFLMSETTWDSQKPNYGLEAQQAGDGIAGRSAAARCDDLQDFLLMLASYLPHGYITDKLLKKSVSFESAFAIIEDHYGVTPSQKTFCDFSGLQRLPSEPYRQFYDRMVAFVTKHLVKGHKTKKSNLDGIDVPAGGDILTASLLNLVALQWIEKIHPEMLNIIRTEYAKELRENTSLFTLVPRIALSVDAMLAKYDKIPSVSKVSGEVRGQISTEDKVQVMKIKQGRRNVDKGRSTDSKRFCAGCFYLGNKVSAKINFKHHPADCPRGSAMVALLEAEEEHDDPGKILKVNASPMPKNAEQVPAIQKRSVAVKRVNWRVLP